MDCEIEDEARNRLHVVNRSAYLLRQRGMFVGLVLSWKF